MKKGLLLVNLGTPETPHPDSIRRYLAKFLSDKRVIDLPSLLRYLLVYGLILPFRPKKLTKAYQAIWTKEGSPLLIHSQNLQRKLQECLGSEWQVNLAMRYSSPSIEESLNELKDCGHLTLLPLYPQYSSAATGSSLEKILRLVALKTVIPSIVVIRDFYQDPGFIEAQAALIKPELANHDFLLFSYHGIPERHLKQGGCPNICTQSCTPINEANQACYRAQCFATSRVLSQNLGLSEEQFALSFQSRLGKTPWIKPYTEELLPSLIQRGIKRLVVACPSFTADCLETLEEIGIRAKKQWLSLGGEKLTLIPCVNDSKLWIDALVKLIMREAGSS